MTVSRNIASQAKSLPVPSFYNPSNVGEIRIIDYGAVFVEAIKWQKQYGIMPSASDRIKIGLLEIDNQIGFCHPKASLFVGGRSGKGALEDTDRAVRFKYRNVHRINKIKLTMDTHRTFAIFHPPFLIDQAGNHPSPMTIVTTHDLKSGKWKLNPMVFSAISGWEPMDLERHLRHYVAALEKAGKYALIIWPFHTMLGGIDHALMPSIQEAAFFHSVCRSVQTDYEVKGGNELTENYSVLQPEVLTTFDGSAIDVKNKGFIEDLLNFDVLIGLGQAKSHCLAWTIDDLLNEIVDKDRKLAEKVWLLSDCTSPVVVPGIIDFTDPANAAFERFKDAGMHVVTSDEMDEVLNGLFAV